DVALSIVGTGRTADNGHFRAEVAQEKLIVASGVPYTIIRATQFMEFLRGIADSSADGNTVRLPPILFQPIAADDVAHIVAELALAAPRNGIAEIDGTSAVQRNRRALSEGGRRPAPGRVRPRGPILGRPARGAFAGTVGRGAPRPYRSRRMAPPLAAKSLI